MMADNKFSKDAKIKSEPSSGSLTNMPTQDEMAIFERDVKPGLIAGIRKAHWENKKKFDRLNGATRYTDRG